MSLAPRAAALRGDDYQHIVGLYEACRALTDPTVATVSVEDSDGGAFDDVVVRKTPASFQPHRYIQVKSSNYNNQAVTEEWLVTAKSANGKSPLQHFHTTWTRLTADGDPFVLTLLSNRNFDHNDPLLKLRDNLTNRVPRSPLDQASTRSKLGRTIKRWADHLGISLDDFKAFVTRVEFSHAESERSWEDRCRPLMRDAGLRDDDDAMSVAKAMVRGWVTTGAGPRNRADIRAEVAAKNLLARSGTLVLAVHGIDHLESADLPNATVDFVDLYPQIDPFQRRQLRDPTAWQTVVLPRLADARTELSAFNSRRVHVVGSMRLPAFFAVGRTYPDVARWVLSVDQRGEEWVTNAPRLPASVETLTDEALDGSGGLLVGFALTHDPTDEILNMVHAQKPHCQRLLVLSAPGGPSRSAVPGPGWAATWVSEATSQVRAAVRVVTDRHVHLILACPAAMAMFAGHQWNLLPNTTVYEHQNPGYQPTMTFSG